KVERRDAGNDADGEATLDRPPPLPACHHIEVPGSAFLPQRLLGGGLQRQQGASHLRQSVAYGLARLVRHERGEFVLVALHRPPQLPQRLAASPGGQRRQRSARLRRRFEASLDFQPGGRATASHLIAAVGRIHFHFHFGGNKLAPDRKGVEARHVLIMNKNCGHSVVPWLPPPGISTKEMAYDWNRRLDKLERELHQRQSPAVPPPPPIVPGCFAQEEWDHFVVPQYIQRQFTAAMADTWRRRHPAPPSRRAWVEEYQAGVFRPLLSGG